MIPVVSIVIPVFNSEKTLAATLDSIRAQGFIFWECILVDDGSTDDSLRLARKHAQIDQRFQSVVRPDSYPKGASSCRNYGISIASGKFIQFFDADDLMDPSHLSKKMRALTVTGADVVVCQLREVFLTGQTPRLNEVKLNLNPADLVGGEANWYVCGPIWRKECLSGIFFPENISNLDDLVFNLRALRRARKVTYIHEPLIDYIRHGQGITGAYSSSDCREIESTIRARSLIQRELRLEGEYDFLTSRAQIRAIAHLGYLIGIRRTAKLTLEYVALVRESVLWGTWLPALKTLFALGLWTLTGKGYSLVRWLKS